MVREVTGEACGVIAESNAKFKNVKGYAVVRTIHVYEIV